MLALLAALAAPQDSLQQDERLEPTVINAEHQRISLGQINNLYRNGRPSNDVRLAGLFVHQHDNTEARPPAKGHPRPLPEQQSSVMRRVRGGVAVVGRGWGGRERSEQLRGEGAGELDRPTTIANAYTHRPILSTLLRAGCGVRGV
jgi:hypothetical protein